MKEAEKYNLRVIAVPTEFTVLQNFGKSLRDLDYVFRFLGEEQNAL
ncbi:MAG: hypothetical protein Q8N99_08855 [Nanoarchaeota archaeon]|nr:hypothetical protein [Nanoarchaeota archaeon]